MFSNILNSLNGLHPLNGSLSVEQRVANMRVRPKEQIMASIRAQQVDDEIQSGPTKLSLRDPLSMTRLKDPCRASSCVHLGCFDATMWLNTLKQTSKPLCPSCDRTIDPDELVIDGLVAEILTKVHADVQHVIVEADGEWHTEDRKVGSSKWMRLHGPPAPRESRNHWHRHSPALLQSHSTRGNAIVVVDSSDSDEGGNVIEVADSSDSAENGTVDAAALIQSMKDLNSSIRRFSLSAVRGFSEQSVAYTLNKGEYRRLRDALNDTSLKCFVDDIESRKDLTFGNIAHPIVAGVIVAQLMHVVFRPFAPGLDEEKSSVLQWMYEKIQQSETQEKSASWRSITYNHAVSSSGPTFLAEAVVRCVLMVREVLTALSGSDIPPLSDVYQQLICGIFEAAMKMQRRVKTEYLDLDYEAYSTPLDGNYNAKEMDANQSGEMAPTRVWSTVGLGIKARRRWMIHGGELFEESVPVKAAVICNNWNPNV